MANSKSNNESNSGAMKVGLGLAAVAAAAAGAYYFYGKNGSKHRKQLRGWAVKAKGEVMEKIETLKDVTEKSYMDTVDNVLSHYRKLKSVGPKEWAAVQREFKNSWKSIKSEINKVSKKPKKA